MFLEVCQNEVQNVVPNGISKPEISFQLSRFSGLKRTLSKPGLGAGGLFHAQRLILLRNILHRAL